MSFQWEAEQTIEPPVALSLIQAQFPELKAEKIHLLGIGWDNTAFLVNEKLIFRFPRRQVALSLLETEWSSLPTLSQRLPIPIPCPQWKGSPSSHFPWPFIGYPMLPGLTACHANLSEAERTALAEPIANFLKTLHAIPRHEFSGQHVIVDHLSRIDGAKLNPKIEQNLAELMALELPIDKKRVEEAIADSQQVRPPMSSAIVHGDFYVRHLLVDEKHRFTGVIDWGDVHVGDPAIDLTIAHSFLPAAAHAKFKEVYGNIAEDTWQLARLRAIFSCTYLILFGHHTGDTIIKKEGLQSLNRICHGFA